MDASEKDVSEPEHEPPEALEDTGERFSNETCGEPTLREMTSSERTQSFHQCLIPTCLAEKLVVANASNNNTISHHSTNHAFRTSPSSTTGGSPSVANSSSFGRPGGAAGTGTPSISLSSALAQHAQAALLQHLNNNTINNPKITDNHLSPKQSRSAIAPYNLGGRSSSNNISGVAPSATSSNSSQHFPSLKAADDKSASNSPVVSSVLLKLEQSGVNIGMLDQFVKNSNAALNGLNVNSVAARLLEESLKIHRQQQQLQAQAQVQASNGESSSYAPASLYSQLQNHNHHQHRQGHEETAPGAAESLGVDRQLSANGDLSGVNDDVLMTNLERNLNERGSAVTSYNHLGNHNNNDGEQSFSGSETVDASACSPSSSVTTSSSSSAYTSAPSSSSFGVDCNNMSINSIVSGLGLNMVGPNITTSPGGSLDEHDCDEDKVINGDSFSPGDVPDPDAIKMFVGQVPKNLSETQLKTLFEEFGRVFQINVLRDKVTKQSKGCCFVTFYTRKAALDAQNALHNVKTLPGMNHPIQMKPADNENRYERKLFVGMLSKKCNETDVRNMFSRYGHIDECTVLRDLHGQSRGCAFITFASKQCAQSAIKALHHSITMEGCTSPLVVKFADTQKDKDQKRNQQLQSSMINNFSGPASGVNPMVPQQFFSELLVENILQQLQQQQQSNNYFSQLNSLGIQGIPGLAALNSPNPAAALAGLTASHSSTANNDLATLAALANFSGVSPNQHSMVLGVQAALAAAAMGGNHASLSPSGASNSANGIGSTNSLASLSTGNSLPSGYNAYANALRSSAVNKQAEGPEGANLFIYHLPPEWSDADLISMFSNYGTVISAKVFIDKQTNLSKCFGFVSYDNGVSAQLAIQSMNGFQVGMKRLKVQLKRSKDAAKPY